MKTIFLITLGGITTTFTNKKYIAVMFSIFTVMFILFTLIPVFAVVGNSITIQLTIFTLGDYMIIAMLSGLYALFITMQIYAMRSKRNVRDVGTAVGGGIGALVAGVAGTAFCASCLAPLFALFGIGFGGVIFVLQYRVYFVVGITILMLIAIYLTARKIQRVCAVCSPEETIS